MTALPYMKLYVADYLGDTARLSCEQHGAYLLLIFEYWRNGALMDDDAELAAVAKLDARRWRATRPKLERFFQIGDGRWTHKRVEAELAEAREAHGKLSTNGKRGAEKRWRGDGPAIGQGNGPAIGHPNGNHSHSHIPPKKGVKGGRKKSLPDTTLPEDWAPDLETEAQRVRIAGKAIDVAHEAEAFKAHAKSCGRTLKDWDAGFRTWVLKRIKDAPASRAPLLPFANDNADPDAVWRKRLGEYGRNGHWNTADWGPRPGREGCAAPALLIAELPERAA